MFRWHNYVWRSSGEQWLLTLLDHLGNSLKLSSDKCQACQTSIKYGGHIKSQEGLGRLQKYHWSGPNIFKTLRGFRRHYRNWLKDCSKTAKPLNEFAHSDQTRIGAHVNRRRRGRQVKIPRPGSQEDLCLGHNYVAYQNKAAAVGNGRYPSPKANKAVFTQTALMYPFSYLSFWRSAGCLAQGSVLAHVVLHHRGLLKIDAGFEDFRSVLCHKDPEVRITITFAKQRLTACET